MPIQHNIDFRAHKYVRKQTDVLAYKVNPSSLVVGHVDSLPNWVLLHHTFCINWDKIHDSSKEIHLQFHAVQHAIKMGDYLVLEGGVMTVRTGEEVRANFQKA